MPVKMHNVLFCILGVVCTLKVTGAQSGFCTREISGLPVVDMCQSGSWTLGRVFLSINSSSMGDNSRCECYLRGRTSSQNTATTVTMWQLGSTPFGCINQHVINVAWPSELGVSGGGSTNITCFTPVNQAFTTSSYTQPVTLTQLRSDVSFTAGFCLYLQPQDYANNNMELTCQGSVGIPTEMESPTSSTSKPLFSSTRMTSLPSSSASSYSSSRASTILVSSAPPGSSNNVAGDVTKGEESTTRAESFLCSPSQSSTTAYGLVSIDPCLCTTPLVAVAVVGWLLTLALAVVVLLLSLRLKRMSKLSSGQGADNSAYTSLSDVTRVNPRADPNYAVIQSEGSSSQTGGSDPAASRGVYETV